MSGARIRAENAALKSRLEEATKELKDADKVINEQWATGVAVESENIELKKRLEEAERELAKVSDMASTYKAAYTGAKTVLDSLGYEISFNGEEDITGRGAQVDGGEE